MTGADSLQAAHAFLADNQISGQRLAVCLVFIDQREILVGQQLTPQITTRSASS
jgi:hypothetical protein